jgi:hypothetical protein
MYLINCRFFHDVTLTDFPLAAAEDMSNKDSVKLSSLSVGTWKRMCIVSTRFKPSFIRFQRTLVEVAWQQREKNGKSKN